MAPDTLDRIVFGWLIRIGSGYIESGLVATIRSNRIGLELALSDRAGTDWGDQALPERVISDRIWSGWVELPDWIGLDRIEVDGIAPDKHIRSSCIVLDRIGSVFELKVVLS